MKKAKAKSSNQDLWLTSYADLITAIFSVMVLFVSFSKIDIEKYDMIQRLMIENEKKEYENFSTLAQIKDKITKIAEKNHLEKILSVKLSKDGLSINFSSTVQFKSGSHKLLESNIQVMKPVFDEIIKQSSYRYIDISGHTDHDRGIKVSNWELSALRALSIQRYLEKNGLNTKNVRLLANAENKPLVEYENKTAKELEIAKEANRRVSITIGDAKFDDLKRIKNEKYH